MNKIECKTKIRHGFVDRYVDGIITKCEKNTEFFDFIIDGNSLYDRFQSYDLISVLQHKEESAQREEIEKLLLKRTSELDSRRYFLYVCPMCADLGCGAITVSIRLEGENIIWSDFSCEDGETTKTLKIGTFMFDWLEYSDSILSSIFDNHKSM